MRGILLATAVCAVDHHQAEPVSRIAFGSCNKQYLPQPIWSTISALSPEAFFWIGDAAYTKDESIPTLRQCLETQRHQANYSDFVSSGIYIDGVWDDHDFGVNDADSSVHSRQQRQKLFQEFLGVNRDRPGMYSSHTFGEGDRQVKVILLDVRYHRETHGSTVFPLRNKMPIPVIQGLSRGISKLFDPWMGGLLGEDQWKWLEDELSSEASVNLLVSGVQFLSDVPVLEGWHHYPAELKRLMALLAKVRPKGLILSSGDVHYAELLYLKDDSVLEVTTSGMTHTCLPAKIYEFIPNADILCQWLVWPWKKGPFSVLTDQLNFGLLELDWERRMFNVSVRDVDGQARLSYSRSMDAVLDFQNYYEPQYLGSTSVYVSVALLVVTTVYWYSKRK